MFWIEADTAVRKDIVDFMMKEARTAKERSELGITKKNIVFNIYISSASFNSNRLRKI